MPGADEVRSRRERDKLTIAEACAELGFSRRTFYKWQTKGRAPRGVRRSPAAASASAGPNTSGGCPPLARQAMTTDTRGQTCMLFYGKAGRLFPGQKAIILPGELWE